MISRKVTPIILTALLPAWLATAYTVDPPTTAASDTIKDCTFWDVATDSDTCQSLADYGFITVDQLTTYNPSLANGCHIVVGNSYCVEENYGVPPPTTTTAATTTSGGVTTPTPTQDGMTKGCTKFHKVVSGDGCAAIESANNISFDQLYQWNPAIGDDCASLIIGYYVCVGVAGSPTSGPTTTTPGNGITTPTPTQSGMTGSCNKFHKVVSGDSCSAVEDSAGISFAQLYAWNPAIGENCQSLVIGDYVCVGVIGGGSTGPTTTTGGNGITTPTPTQSGMTKNCNKFHKVVSGDGCAAIESSAGISFAQLYQWNPAIGSDCTPLIIGDYVCIGVIGGGTAPTTTTGGNGITTPTPTQSGMTKSCNKFHKVVSGDGCAAIESSAGISFDQLYAWNPAIGSDCTSLIIGDYVCVGIIGGDKPTTTKPGNGITTPTPTQSGMVSNCDRFYKVQSGDGCYDIAAEYKIPTATFYEWNPAVQDDCSKLQPDYYVCVHTKGYQPPPTTTQGGNGIPTPTPIQSGMTTNCNKFHKVVSGDTCDQIVKSAGISSSNFYKWNPTVGSDCKSLWLGYYVCIGVK